MRATLFARLLAVVSLSLFFLISCGSDDKPPKADFGIAPDGLSGRIILRLYEHDGQVFAATDHGLYSKNKGHGRWLAAGLSNREVLDIAFLDDEHYLASTSRVVDEIAQYQLMETTDGGETWSEITHDFGGEDDPEAIHGLHYDDDNNALYATGIEVLARSLDEGRHWEILSGEWHGFGQRKTIVKRNPATNEVWYGGQNALEQLVLRAYSLDTNEERSYSDLLPNPSVIYGIQFDATNDQRILASGEGGVLESTDKGETWTNLLGDVDYRFYFDVAIDPEDPQTLYTAGWDKNWDTPQPLILEISENGGTSWSKYLYPSQSLFGGVRSLLVVKERENTVLYLGLYRGGIMKVTFL